MTKTTDNTLFYDGATYGTAIGLCAGFVGMAAVTVSGVAAGLVCAAVIGTLGATIVAGAKWYSNYRHQDQKGVTLARILPFTASMAASASLIAGVSLGLSSLLLAPKAAGAFNNSSNCRPPHGNLAQPQTQAAMAAYQQCLKGR